MRQETAARSVLDSFVPSPVNVSRGANYGTFRVTYGDRKKVSVACGERGLSPAVTHHVLQRFAELGQLKLESFLFEPFGNDIATVEG